MAKKIRVQDDLYMYVNKEWMDKVVIPDDRPRAGGFSDLDEKVEKQMMSDFRMMADGQLEIEDKNVLKAVQLYKMARNVQKRNSDGIAPVLPLLHKIENLTNVDDLNEQLKEFVLNGITLPFVVEVDTDMQDTLHHAVLLGGPSVILPDTTYYKAGMEQQKEMLLGVWKQMTAKLLSYTDLSAVRQQQYLDDALQFDAVVATLVKSSEEWSEYTKAYNPMSLEEVSELLRPVDFSQLMQNLFGRAPEKIIVAEPRFLQGFSQLFSPDAFEKYKHWAYVKELLGATSFLSEELRELGATYSKTLSGIASIPTIEKQSYQLASRTFSEPVGLYYGKKYFGEVAKRDITEMVQEIIDTYKMRIMQKNDFLSAETKAYAVQKLEKIQVKMGYPDTCDKLYDTLTVDETDTLFGAVSKLHYAKICDSFSKLYEDVDRTQWVIPAHMVNACYNPTCNDITFPAAILQAPFYSVKQSRSENLGGIGAVIGHEISHAFDNNGAHCDADGNLRNWWKQEDFEKFEQRTTAMIEEFDGIELPQGKVNGAFVVSENIADNGGMAVTLDIMGRMPNADFRAYFYNWARVWCMKGRPEYLKLLLSVDVHAPAMLRGNMQPRNFPEWYKAFDVKESDGMYLAPEKRVIIW